MTTILAERYQVQRVLGRGAFGTVYLARDTELRRAVAVKVLHGDELEAKDRRRFHREAEVTARLTSPHVVRLYDHGTDAGKPYVAYEFVPGEDLRAVLRRGPVAAELARAWALQGCAGLAEAHDQGVVHRDLKPENVLLREGVRELVLCDFGLAADAHARTVLTRTEEGTPGTPLYIAIEQLDAGATPASDQFSWALVLAEMRLGRPLREAHGILQRLAGLLATGDHELPEDAAPDLGDWYAPLRRALDPDPTRRFPDIRAFAAALEGRPPPSARPPSASRVHAASDAPPAPSPRAKLRGPQRALAAGGLALALGLGLWSLMGGPGPGSPPAPSTSAPMEARRTAPPEAVLAAYRRLGGPLLDAAGEPRLRHLAPEDQAWVLDDRFPLRWRGYLRAIAPWLPSADANPAAQRLLHGLPAALADQLLGAEARGRKLMLTGIAGGALLKRASARRQEVAEALSELLPEPQGDAGLLLRVTLAARGLRPRQPLRPALEDRVLARGSGCGLLARARQELLVTAPGPSLTCTTRRTLLGHQRGCSELSQEARAEALARTWQRCDQPADLGRELAAALQTAAPAARERLLELTNGSSPSPTR